MLVVDDNVDSAESMAVLLRLYGHDVRLAHDGEAALEAALAFRPDVMFLTSTCRRWTAMRWRGDCAWIRRWAA